MIKEKENPVAPREIRGEIIFDRVSFEHNGRLILKDISFRVRPGGTLAIMGMTGAGKSSIINLIPGIMIAPAARFTWTGLTSRTCPCSC